MASDSEKFPGFPPEMRRNFWMYPRVMDTWWYQLSGSESKVLDFILRRTWGWEKVSDRISLSQFAKGGRNIGNGTGLSQRQIVTAVQGLESKGYIHVKRQIGRINEYKLVVQEMQRSNEEISQAPSALPANAGVQKLQTTVDNVPIEEAIEKMYTLYSKLVRPGQRLTREARRNLTDRFADYHPKQLVLAMKNAVADDYWGDIVQKNTVAWFFSSEERIARFLALGPHEAPSDPKGQVKP